MRRASIEAISTTHRLIPVGEVWEKAKYFSSSDNVTLLNLGLEGRPFTCCSTPVLVFLTLMFSKLPDRLGPLVAGLILIPPIFSSGWDRSSMDAYPRRSNTSIKSPVLLKLTDGVTGALTSSNMALGGS